MVKGKKEDVYARKLPSRSASDLGPLRPSRPSMRRSSLAPDALDASESEMSRTDGLPRELDRVRVMMLDEVGLYILDRKIDG
jgi:hypothetical protein